MGELAVVVLVKSGEGGRGIRDLTGGEFAIVIGVQGSDEGGEGRTLGLLGAGLGLIQCRAVRNRGGNCDKREDCEGDLR
jgi:hypothetical protein